MITGCNKNQLRDLQNDLNQNMITAINNLAMSNLITSNQVDYMSLLLIPTEALENEQEHIAATR